MLRRTTTKNAVSTKSCCLGGSSLKFFCEPPTPLGGELSLPCLAASLAQKMGPCLSEHFFAAALSKSESKLSNGATNGEGMDDGEGDCDGCASRVGSSGGDGDGGGGGGDGEGGDGDGGGGGGEGMGGGGGRGDGDGEAPVNVAAGQLAAGEAINPGNVSSEGQEHQVLGTPAITCAGTLQWVHVPSFKLVHKLVGQTHTLHPPRKGCHDEMRNRGPPSGGCQVLCDWLGFQQGFEAAFTHCHKARRHRLHAVHATAGPSYVGLRRDEGRIRKF